MAWLTSPLYKPGDAEADIAATILAADDRAVCTRSSVTSGRSRRRVRRRSSRWTSGLQFDGDCRAPGHTAEEIEKAIDEELAAFRDERARRTEVERARNTIETDIIGEPRVGFGGLAERLNTYNHYLGTPDYLRARHSALPRMHSATMQSFVRDQLQADGRVSCYASARRAEDVAADHGCRARDDGRERRVASRSMPTNRGGTRCRMPARASRCSCTPQDRDACERSHADPQRTARTCRWWRRILVLKTAVMRTHPVTAGSGEFRGAMLDEGTTTRNTTQIADEVARLGGSLTTCSSMDASTVSADRSARTSRRCSASSRMWRSIRRSCRRDTSGSVRSALDSWFSNGENPWQLVAR
jgi:hypothetical protein